MSDKIYMPVDPNAQPCVRNVLKYLSDISGDRIITGQHTQTMAMEELECIRRVTGKEPALLGFELLSYSPNINYADTDDECMTEVTENYGTLKRAWEWAEKKGLITFTWHWFSPLGGHSKSFFTENTDFLLLCLLNIFQILTALEVTILSCKGRLIAHSWKTENT